MIFPKIYKKSIINTRVYLLILSLISLLATSCGEQSPTTPDDPPLEEGEYRLESNAHDVTGKLLGYNPDTGIFTFANSKDIPDLESGDVIFSEQTPIINTTAIGRVQTIQGNQVLTYKGTLNDVVSECNLRVKATLTNINQNTSEAGSVFNVPFSYTLYNPDGIENNGDETVINGRAQFTVIVDDIYLNAGVSELKEFNFQVTSAEVFDLELNCSESTPILSSNFTIGTTIHCPTIWIGPVGLDPTITLKGKIQGRIGKLNICFKQQANFTSKIHYDPETKWISDASFSNSFELELSEFSSESDATLSIGPEVELAVYAIAGVSAGINGFIHGEADIDGSSLDWLLTGGYYANLGARISVFGWSLANYSKEVFRESKTIAQGNTPRLEAALNITPSSGEAPLEVLLDASGSEPSQDIVRYTFNFGDGSPTYEENNSYASDGIFDGSTIHTYDKIGIYTAVVIIENSSGQSDEDSEIVTVEAPLLPGKIVYSSGNGGDFNIYYINPNTLIKKTIIETSEGELVSDVSSDGTKVLYSSKVPFTSDDFDVYEININGTGKTQLTTSGRDESSAVYSPDGTKIAYEAGYTASDTDIYLMNSDGSNPYIIYNVGNYYNWDLDWGVNKIAFYSNLPEGTGIYTINPDGHGCLFLATGRNPLFFFDGTKIIYTSWDTGNTEIWQMNSDGSNKINISNSEDTIDNQPCYSPDGEYIVYVSRPVGTYSESNELWIMKADGSNKTRITFNSVDDGLPIWSN